MDGRVAIDKWVSVHEFKPSVYVDSVFLRFVYYHVRPTQTVRLAQIMDCGDVIVSPYQTSLIVGIKGDYFVCWTVSSKSLDSQARYSMSEMAVYRDLGQVVKWHLNASNFLQGPWEIFNGSNPILLGTS